MSAIGHAFTFFLAVFILPILRAVPFLRPAAESVAEWLSGGKKRKSNLSGHQASLEDFYAAQAESYDATRGVLLKGREEMLERALAQILEKRDMDSSERRTIWIDIGGGTGMNIESMGTALAKLRPGVGLFDVFERIYLLDLTPSLCEVARKRFAKLGWDVDVVEGDAGTWRPEGWVDSGRAGLVTMSYSLSMMPSPYPPVDNAISLLAPNGIFGVVDFYTSPWANAWENDAEKDPQRKTNWFMKSFWSSWFAIDGIHLNPERRLYVERKFRFITSRSYRNLWMGLPFVRIPYYIFLGTPRTPEPLILLDEKRGRASPPAELDGSRASSRGNSRKSRKSSNGSVSSVKSAEFVPGGI